jgi:type I restriction-modification system DNA methylase subunit
MRLKLQDLIDKQNFGNLVNFYVRTLPPRVAEKEKFSEVFTPPERISEMIEDLSQYYFKQYKKKLFELPNIKYFDPCAGRGNFFAVLFKKLDEGLLNVIKDEEERKKHILEKMLY